MDFRKHLIEQLGQEISHLTSLSGGCVGSVYAARLEEDGEIVIKTGSNGAKLDVEGRMLKYLATHSPLKVPAVLLAHDNLLVMERLPHDGRMAPDVEVQAADAIAALHNVRSDLFGLDFDTLIGGLPQSNRRTVNWFEFYGQQRLMKMADQAFHVGKLPAHYLSRLENLCYKLPDIAPVEDTPRLLHGDLWGGNVLSFQGQLTGFIDPAIYYGHPEMDLAFSTLFRTFDDRFFARYREHHIIAPGFFEERCDLYNLYPLLVHVRLFGGSYLLDVDRVLSRFGC